MPQTLNTVIRVQASNVIHPVGADHSRLTPGKGNSNILEAAVNPVFASLPRFKKGISGDVLLSEAVSLAQVMQLLFELSVSLGLAVDF